MRDFFVLAAAGLSLTFGMAANATVGGQEVVKSEYPWVGRTEGCTGAVVAGKWHLTAAHCYIGDKIYHDNTLTVPGGVEVFTVENLIRHPEFCSYLLGTGVTQQECMDQGLHTSADIALWEMDRSLRVNKIVPIGIDVFAPGKKTKVFGFGHPDMSMNLETDWLPLNYAERWSHLGPWDGCTPTTNDFNDMCWKSKYLVYTDQTNDTDVAGGSTRNGDSGGPYVVDDRIVAVHQSQSTWDSDRQDWTYIMGTSLSAYSSEDWIAQTIDSWHAPTVVNVGEDPFEMTVQSIFANNIVDGAVVSGDVTIDTASSTCITQGTIEPFDVCTYVLESNGGSGTVDLGGFAIEVNPTVEISLSNGVEAAFSGSTQTLFKMPIVADVESYGFTMTGLPSGSRVLAQMGETPTESDFDHEATESNGTYSLNIASESVLSDTWYVLVLPSAAVTDGRVTASYVEFAATHSQGTIYNVNLGETVDMHISGSSRIAFSLENGTSGKLKITSNLDSGEQGALMYYSDDFTLNVCSWSNCEIDNVFAERVTFMVDSASTRMAMSFTVTDPEGDDTGTGGGDTGTGGGNTGNDNSGGGSSGGGGGGGSVGWLSLVALLGLLWRRRT